MRRAFVDSLIRWGVPSRDFLFFTGDLGFAALEPLREQLGTRFLNAGVAEQNMVSAAAGAARVGFRPWVYSIAPFVYARPFEQVRNDVCFHKLPVVLVGNGGGYGYGVMGATHHAIDDYGVLSNCPNLKIVIPAFDEDLVAVTPHLVATDGPIYLRLGLSEKPAEFSVPEWAPWRRLITGSSKQVVLSVGPIGGGLWLPLSQSASPPEFWLVSQLPLSDIPQAFLDSVANAEELIVVEEHGASGSVGQQLAVELLKRGIAPTRFECRQAKGYPTSRYGSQRFHRRECGLDAESIVNSLSSHRSEQ